MIDQTKQLYFLKAVVVFQFASGAILMPYLPLYLSAQGFKGVEIGLIIGVGPFVGIFAQPMWGFISDKFQSIKYLLYFLYFMVFIASIGLFFTGSFILVFLSTIFMFFFFSACTPLIDSYIFSTIKQNGKGNYGSIRLWGSLGFAFTALIAGPIIVYVGIEKLYILFWLTLLCIYPFLFLLKDRKEKANTVKLSSLSGLLKQRRLLMFLGVILLIGIPNKMNDAMLGMHLQNLGAIETIVGLAWMLGALSEIPVFYYLSKHIDRFNPIKILGWVSFFYSLRWLSYSLVESPVITSFLQLSHSITFGAFWIIAVQTIVKMVPDHLRSTGQALVGVAFGGLAAIIGSFGGGAIFDAVGGNVMYTIMACISMVAAIVIYFSKNWLTEEKEAIKSEQLVNVKKV
ncbi:MFS transporter [Evansella cellulosilytica]|uniref:Major facilitator superfamily MFS_1 n=1 Tax=Evansella cellulosilytica (strain ATCC 21833 / DSM 2522 / FERM P-1141 / JCM 9156 / N-4) TaxID=649639 RepID=E6TQM7_EVAC2|nr:MFS transporter [Evansella cellulosilytica]ADU30538.1 major facilitator superfamily MFS_1 [Evansella cellulosilytica DSM 2522]